jgi:hypothetical protein
MEPETSLTGLHDLLVMHRSENSEMRRAYACAVATSFTAVAVTGGSAQEPAVEISSVSGR